MNDVKITRALLSVSDKTGLIELATALKRHGVELLASGGTGKLLRENTISFTTVESFTGNPEAFDGRMKTLSFKLESALLYDRNDPKHVREAEHLGIPPIDLVVCNFYPFEQAAARGDSWDELVHEIDVGGPTMVRAAAKNHGSVAVLVDPADYHSLMEELHGRGGKVSHAFRKELMRKAFHATLNYDRAICETFTKLSGAVTGRALRYGENPHQKAAFVPAAKQGAVDWEPIGGAGVDISYNNILDAEAAFGTVRDLYRLRGHDAGCVIVKHQNPCGIAVARDARTAVERAWAGDPVSAFGGIVALTRPVDLELARWFDASRFVEVIMAPGFEPAALEHLKANKKNVRLLKIRSFDLPRPPVVVRVEGGTLEQDADDELDAELQEVTKMKMAGGHRDLCRFAAVCAKWIKSNAISLVRATSDGGWQMIGMGSGQPNRVDAIRRLCIPKAEAVCAASGEVVTEVFKGAVLASDAFFPFPDSVEEAARAGIRAIVQPGGSKRDSEVIAAADKLGVAMAFTNRRHFRH